MGLTRDSDGGCFLTRTDGAPHLGRMVRWFCNVSIGLMVLLALNVANPEALVVRENVDRIALAQSVSSDSFDGFYLAEHLGVDAMPTLVDRLDRLTESDRRAILRHVCVRRRSKNPHSWNRSVEAANRALVRTCAGDRAPAS